MKRLIYLLSLLLVLNSCASDFLDTKPQASADTGVIFATTDNGKLAVNGICRMMVQQYWSQQGFNGEGTIKVYFGNYPGNNYQKSKLTGWANTINGKYHENSTSTYTVYPWYYYYKLIGNANAIVLNIDNATGNEADKQFIKAQGLTFRAYSYLMLSQLYCKRWMDSNNGASRGLPLRLDLSTGSLEVSTLGDVYSRIYKDLDEAIELYTASGKDRDKGDNYSPNLNVAYAVYARAALTREDWTNAAKYAALAREGYPLMSNEEYVDGGFNTPNSEWIWSCYSSTEQTLYYYAFFAYQGSNSNAGAARNYPAAISKELIDKIPDTDIRKQMYLVPSASESGQFSTSDGKVTGKSALEKRTRSEYGEKLYSTSLLFAYMQFKFQASALPGDGHINNFRSSEMYLTEAEAYCHIAGKEADAQKLLIELNKDRNPEYTCDKTGEDLLNEVKLYRNFELWGEGFDWFDYKRWREPIVRKTFKNGGSFHAQFAVTVNPEDENNWCWVFPAKETNYNESIDSNIEK